MSRQQGRAGECQPVQVALEVFVDRAVDQASAGYSRLPTDADIGGWAAAALAADRSAHDHAQAPAVRHGLSVKLVGRQEMQALNARWRQHDRVTNVLSFPSGMPPLAEPGEPAQHWLGDIVLCADVLADEAATQRKALRDHWAHLVVHGTLHLCGMDHEDAATAEVMETLEIRILSGMGIDNPYAQPR